MLPYLGFLWGGICLWGQILIRGVYVHGGPVSPQSPADILIAGDTIAAVGSNLPAAPGYTIVEGQGLHAYPGLVALSAPTGLIEVEAVRATRDARETGDYNPNALAYTAFNIDSRVLPTLVANGILYAEAAPQGSVIAGQSALFRLQGRTREEAVVLPQAALYLDPPSLRPPISLPPDKQEKARKEALTAWEKLYSFLEKAQRWCQGDSGERDLRYAALCPYFEGQRPVVIEAHWAEDIEAALSLGRRFGFRIGILGGQEADKVASELKAAKAVVILRRTHALPPTEDSPWDASFTLPRRLLEKGIPVILAHESFWNQRNLPYQAGTAAAYGLPPEEALKLITEAPAQWLGLNRLGRIAPGYKASIILTEGDLLDPPTSRVRRAWIEGKEINLSTNPQEILYQRYK